MSKSLSRILCLLLVLSMLASTACTGGVTSGDTTAQPYETEAEPPATESIGSKTETETEIEAETEPPVVLGEPRDVLVTTKGAVDNMKFSPLPLGQVQATSWLKNQLLLQAEQVTKQFEKLSPDFVGMAVEYIEKNFAGCDKNTIYRKMYQRGYTSEEILEAIENQNTEN